jgi:hypothetical protein
LVGKLEERILLGRSRRRWENSDKIDFGGIVWVCVKWINLAEDSTSMKLRVFGNSSVAEWREVSEKGLCSME